MNIPEIRSYEDQAVDAVVAILNRSKETLGERQTLKQLATSRDVFSSGAKVVLTTLKCPLVITIESLIKKTIEKTWQLTNHLMYYLKYIGGSKNECSNFYYFEAVFSQPVPAHPIPQATASVFFQVEDKQIGPPEIIGLPKMTFRVEGHHTDYDVRYVLLVPDWILSVIQMKIKLFKRIEDIQLF